MVGSKAPFTEVVSNFKTTNNLLQPRKTTHHYVYFTGIEILLIDIFLINVHHFGRVACYENYG